MTQLRTSLNQEIKNLLKFDFPAGFLLLFIPCLLGVIIDMHDVKQLSILWIFFLGSVLSLLVHRIINDILDREIDSKVSRTKFRPLVSGAISLKYFLVSAVILSLLGLIVLLQLPIPAIILCVVFQILACFYPLAKRFTYWPQIPLGTVSSSGLLISYISLHNNLSVAAVCAYIGCILWTIGCDIMYSFADLQDDIKVGVKTLSVKLHNLNYRFWLKTIYSTSIVLIVIGYLGSNYKLTPTFLLLTLVSWIGLMRQTLILDINNSNNCVMRFYISVYLLLLIPIAILLTR